MLFDTHCHPILNKEKDITEIIKTFREENPEGFLNFIGSNIKKSIESIKLANKYDFAYTTIGIHPCDVGFYDNLDEAIFELEKLYLENKEKIIGIGECGLDYFHIETEDIGKEKQKQKDFFIAQINLAKKYNLPVVIHNRDSKDDVFEIIQKTNCKNFVFHCFTENIDYANKLINFSSDCKISFSGIVTFKNAKDVQEVAKNIPLNKILVETDCPYLTPTPLRGKEENEPRFTKFVLDFICDIRNEDNEEIKKQIFDNSVNFFGIKK